MSQKDGNASRKQKMQGNKNAEKYSAEYLEKVFKKMLDIAEKNPTVLHLVQILTHKRMREERLVQTKVQANMYRLSKKNERVKELYELIKTQLHANILSATFDDPKQFNLAKLVLTSNYNYSDKSKLELTGKDGGAIESEQRVKVVFDSTKTKPIRSESELDEDT